MISKKVLNSTNTRNNHNSNNQVIIHTEINNYRPLKEYIINLNGLGNNNNNINNNKYQRHISPENFIFSQQKSNRNKYMRNQNEIINNSFNNQNKSFWATQNIKHLKPYKKKNVLFNPNKSKEKIQNIKLDLTNYTESITNCITDRSFDRTKVSFYKEEADSSFFNNNNDNNANKYKDRNDINILGNKPINNILYNNNFHTINNYNYNNSKTTLNTSKKCRKIPLSKKHIINKDFILNKINKKTSYKKNNTIDKYHQRFTQILILLLEKYFKTYLLKTKYEFINNLKKYHINKNTKSKIRILFNTNYLTERNTEYKDKNIFNTIYNNKYKQKNENILFHKLKNENIKTSPDKLNFSELFRNRSELFKKQETIKRRKDSKNRSRKKSDESDKNNKNNKNIIFNNIQNNYINIIKKNKSIDNKTKKFTKIYPSYNRIKPMLIVKKIKTKDNRINIDIKYLEQINIRNKQRFFKLKISKTNNINIVGKINSFVKFDKIYYKIENQNDYTFKKEKKLSCIQEEE